LTTAVGLTPSTPALIRMARFISSLVSNTIPVLCANFLCVNAPWGPLKVSNQSRFPGAAQRSAGQLQQQPAQGPDFSLGGPPAQSLANRPTQARPLQRLALVRMRRPPRLVVPGAGAAVHEVLFRPAPGPCLCQAVQPQAQVEAAHTAVHVADLLLPRPPHL